MNQLLDLLDRVERGDKVGKLQAIAARKELSGLMKGEIQISHVQDPSVTANDRLVLALGALVKATESVIGALVQHRVINAVSTDIVDTVLSARQLLVALGHEVFRSRANPGIFRFVERRPQ